jgi:hypothetical protein
MCRGCIGVTPGAADNGEKFYCHVCRPELWAQIYKKGAKKEFHHQHPANHPEYQVSGQQQHRLRQEEQQQQQHKKQKQKQQKEKEDQQPQQQVPHT